MAYPTAVNDQVTDSVTQVNTKTLGDSPAVSTSNLFIATSQALANAAQNATNNQQQSYVTMQTATTQSVNAMITIGTSVIGKISEVIINGSNKTPPVV